MKQPIPTLIVVATLPMLLVAAYLVAFTLHEAGHWLTIFVLTGQSANINLDPASPQVWIDHSHIAHFSNGQHATVALAGPATAVIGLLALAPLARRARDATPEIMRGIATCSSWCLVGLAALEAYVGTIGSGAPDDGARAAQHIGAPPVIAAGALLLTSVCAVGVAFLRQDLRR